MIQKPFELSGLATMIGSMPHQDPIKACDLVLKYLPEIPAWPQLPRRASVENMFTPFIEGFPGLESEGDRTWVDRSQDVDDRMEQLYTAYLHYEDRGDLGWNAGYNAEISEDNAKGFNSFLGYLGSNQQRHQGLRALKGQITGPISMGLAITDQDRRSLIYDQVLADALAKHLRLKAAWQNRRLEIFHRVTIMFVDEPYLSSIGSAFVSLPREWVKTLLNEVLSGLKPLSGKTYKGIHCCGNTDWSVLLETSLDILNFDAYKFGQTLSLYPAEVGRFLDRGGVIAWGIVPSEEKDLAKESVASLRDRLEETMGLLCRKGINYGILKDRCLLTPSCGLGSLSIEAAERALELLSGLSVEVRKREK